MKQNITKTFLLLTLVFLLVSLTAVNASDNNNTCDMYNSSTLNQENADSHLENQQAVNEQTIKSVNNRNNVTKQEINKKQKFNNIRKSEDKIETTLSIKFLNNEEDEISTENYLFTHIDEEYTLDISLTEDEHETPITGKINLYLLDNPIAEEIILDNTGQIQKTYTINKTGSSLTIYAEYEGNENYSPQSSQILYVDSEAYQTSLTLNEIDNSPINSTINITGKLYYKDNIPIPNSNIFISLNNNRITSATTDSDGKYSTSYKLENLPVQDMAKLQVEFISPSEKFTDAFNEKNFDIEKISSIITIDDIGTLSVRTPKRLGGSVIDENKVPYTGTLKVKIIDKETGEIYYSNDTVVINKGVFTFNFSPEKALNYNLTLLIEENEYFLESYKNLEFNVEKAQFTLNFEEVYESLVLDNVSINAQLIDQNNNPVSNIPIIIQTDNEMLGTIKTDSNGNINFSDYIFQEVIDDDFFSVYFYIEETDDNEYLYEESSYYLSKRNVQITLNTSETVTINKTIDIQGCVLDAHDNNIIPSGNMKLFINSQEITQIPINPEGNFIASINVNEDYIGQSKLFIETLFVPENHGIYYSDKFEYAEVIHELLKTNLEIISVDSNVGDNITITVKLQDENNNNLNETVSLSIRDSQFNPQYNQNLPLTNGIVTISFIPAQEGVYYIFTQYNGKENIYSSSTDELEISVEKNPTLIYLNPIKNPTYVNDTIIISGILNDNHNNPIPHANISIEIYNSTTTNLTSIQTDSQGRYATNFTPKTIAENISIRVNYNGSNVFNGNYNLTEIQVIKHNSTTCLDLLETPIKYNNIITIKGNVTEKLDNSPANGSITIKINNELIETISLENGTFQYDYLVKEVSNNNIILIEFLENEVYNPSETICLFNVTALQTSINIHPINDTRVNTKVTISGTITDENDENLTTYLKVKINDEELNQFIKANNGVFSFEYIPQEVSEYTVNISYVGDDLHYISSNSVSKFNTTRSTLYLENITTTVDDKEKTVTITGEVSNPENISTENVEITIKIGEETYVAKINENGTFNVTSDVLTPGSYPISIEINQTEYFDYYNQNLTTIHIKKDNPIISLKEITNATYSVEQLIIGNLTDSYNRPLNNTQLLIIIGDETYNLITDNEGIFKKSIGSFIAGLNTIFIEVPETEYIYSAEYNTTFSANKQFSKILLDENTRIIPGEDINIKGQLFDINNIPINDKQLNITVNNKNYIAYSDENGQFNITEKNARVGSYNIKVTFEDSNYEPSNSSKTLNVTKLSVNLVVEDVVSVVGENITLKARVTDEYGNNVNGGNLVFKLNGRSLRMDDRFDTNVAAVRKLSVINGLVEYTIPADIYLRNGKNISASYSGSYKYESAKSNIALASIKLRDAKLQVTTSNNLAKQHENITFIVNIEDITKNSFNENIINQNASVFFKINDVSIRDDKGNIIYVPVVNSTAKYNYSTNIMASVDNDNNLRNYTVTAVYVNPNYYPTVRNSTYFNIEKSNVTINVTTAKVSGNLLHLKASLKDYLGYNLVGENKVCVKINGVTYKENNLNKYFQISDGILDIDSINIENNTIRTVEIITGERQAYNAARITINNLMIES
ncbi:MAG: hypothetical protein E7Z85_02330 [Methanosphaera stadtmanae]|nr:hypothetical protein [Methanosphaera stadtmanae]